MSYACPYCAAPLPALPSRKTQCKACGQPMYVKYTPDNPTKRLMTAAQAEAAEAAWREKSREHRDLAIASTLDLPPASLPVLGAEVRAIAEDPDQPLHRRKMAAGYLAARSAHQAERREWMRRMAIFDLRRFLQTEVVTTVKILSSSNGGPTCPVCTPLNGKQLPINEAIRTMPIPPKDCPRMEGPSLCMAMYLAVVDADSSYPSALEK